jgi:hypothetical protein
MMSWEDIPSLRINEIDYRGLASEPKSKTTITFEVDRNYDSFSTKDLEDTFQVIVSAGKKSSEIIGSYSLNNHERKIEVLGGNPRFGGIDVFLYYAGYAFKNVDSGFFSCAFGPFRRFKGGNDSWNDVYDSNPHAAAHMSLFGEDVALTQIEPWLIKLEHKRLRGENGHVLDLIRTLLNDRELLPDGTKLIDISPDGLIFEDANGGKIALHQLSDGFRSVLSLTMELIRQLIRVYGEEKTFENLEKQLKEGKNDDPAINYLPGVVLIDEIDAHLHPMWQTQIGQWFTKYFPKLQFIVTTHSPLICRACGENGRIWHLRAPGSEEDPVKLIEGQDRNRLVYGNILDAYGTQAFGSGVMRSDEGSEKFRRLGELNMKSIRGVLLPSERAEYEELQAIFPSGQ